jgi:FkbM family methyltransferase
MINTYFDKIFYINLAKDTDRNEYMLSQFQEFNITNFERYEGIVYEEVPDISLWRNFIKKDEKYVKGQLGCRESMLNIIKLSKERGYKNILILEDDAFMLNDPSDIMMMNTFNLSVADMFYFGGLIEEHYRGQVVCAHACGIKDTLFDDIINMAVPSGMEMDNFYAKIIQHMSYNNNPRGQYNVMMLQPFNTIVQNKKFESNIQLTRGDLIQLTELLKPYFNPKSFMEIGSKDGLDTKYISEYWGIDKNNAFIIEANKYCYQKIESDLLNNPYAKLIFGAASNIDGDVIFNCVVTDNQELVGVSSIKKSTVINLDYEQTIVPCFKLEKLIKENSIELLKIDVEGHAYEVLEGIGEELKNIKGIQVETEMTYAFENQKLDDDVHQYLLQNDFVLIDKKRCWAAQYDCLYVNKKLLSN